MRERWKNKWAVPSSSNDGHYIVAVDYEGNYACGCLGWTRHMPRTDCRHIRMVHCLIEGRPSTAQTIEEAVINRMLGRNIDQVK